MLQFLLNVQSLCPGDGHVLVVGDIWIDHQLTLDQSVSRLKYLRHNSAAGLALGLAEAGLAVTLVGFVGDDPIADVIDDSMAIAGVACDLLHIKSWSTFISAHQHIGEVADAKLDADGRRVRRHKDERALPIDGMSEYESHLQNRAERYLGNASALVLVDWGLGSIAEPRALTYVARQRGVRSIAVFGPQGLASRYGEADHRLDLSRRNFAAGVNALKAALPSAVARRT